MAFQLSPGVNVSEIDLTTVVPSVLTTAGAFAGTFKWGPANQVVLVDSEITLSKTFGTPDSSSAVSFFTAANFLSYGNNLSVVRAVGNTSYNSTVDVTLANVEILLNTGGSITSYYTVGETVYQTASDYANSAAIGTVTAINASHNVLTVSVSSGTFSTGPANTVGLSSGTYHNATSITNISDESIQISNTDEFQYTLLNQNNNNLYGPFMARYPGSLGNSLKVAVFANNNTTAFNSWTYKGYFTSAPNTSTYVATAGGAYDELHIAIIDEDGLFTGSKGSVLETFPFVSKAIDAINVNDGSSNYYKQVIFNKSKYIYAVDPVNYINTYSTWGQTAAGTIFAQIPSYSSSLVGGTDVSPSDADLNNSYNLFNNKETTDISLVITGDASVTVQQHVIDNIVTTRNDCVAFISPPYSAVINNTGNESSSILDWLNNTNTGLQRSTSYAVADSGWKYQFDVYNNVYRWIPLNADVAGLCVYTDNTRDPWYSPAGFNRGAIKNAIKLAWNPTKTYRDTLYSAGVNPVISFPGQGIVLYGDKTLQNKPSAFDHINVRRLFIVLEKSISRAAQFSLFEFNDEFTRSQFVAIITPFLRDIQGRRGITDFKVVCDTTNNTPQVIDSNQFVGDIYIKPARSINYIQLNFVAVGTGVDFNTIVGAA